MLQAGEEPDLANETQFACVGRGVRVENFECDLAFVFQVAGKVNRGEGALSDLSLDIVMAAKRRPEGGDGIDWRSKRWCVGHARRLEHSTLLQCFANIGGLAWSASVFLAFSQVRRPAAAPRAERWTRRRHS